MVEDTCNLEIVFMHFGRLNATNSQQHIYAADVIVAPYQLQIKSGNEKKKRKTWKIIGIGLCAPAKPKKKEMNGREMWIELSDVKNTVRVSNAYMYIGCFSCDWDLFEC